MSEAATLAAAARWARAPLAWSLLLFLVLSPQVTLEVRGALVGAVPPGRAATVPATVDPEYTGGDKVRITYRHPVTQQQVRTYVLLWDASLQPQPGERIEVVVDERDPSNLLLVGDRRPSEQNLLAYGWLPLLPALVALLRMTRVRGGRRLLRAPVPSFAMLGAVTRPRGLARRPLLHLYPVDAEPGDAPVCVVPLAATGGAPLAGPAVPVEVKGSPAPGGRLVARAGERLLWPAGRALAFARHALPRPVHVEQLPDGAPAPASPRPQPVALLRPPLLWFLGRRAALLAGAGLLAVVVTLTTWSGARKAAALYAEGRPVLATVVRADAQDLDVRVEYPADGAAGAEGAAGPSAQAGPQRAVAPVEYPGRLQVGLLYPAVVDPRDPELVRLLAEPYDPVEPVVWGAAPLAGALALALGAARTQRQVRRARHGTPVEVDAWREQDHVALAVPGTRQVLCLVPVWHRHLNAVVPPGRTVAMQAAGDLMPDQPVAVRAAGTWLAVGGRATASGTDSSTLDAAGDPWP